MRPIGWHEELCMGPDKSLECEWEDAKFTPEDVARCEHAFEMAKINETIAASAAAGAEERYQKACIALARKIEFIRTLYLQKPIYPEIRLNEDGCLICDVCHKLMSFDAETSPMRTDMGYGGTRDHKHDDNCFTREYTCPGGHSITVSVRQRCTIPGCGWVGKEDCYCHHGKKLDNWPQNHHTQEKIDE